MLLWIFILFRIATPFEWISIYFLSLWVSVASPVLSMAYRLLSNGSAPLGPHKLYMLHIIYVYIGLVGYTCINYYSYWLPWYWYQHSRAGISFLFGVILWNLSKISLKPIWIVTNYGEFHESLHKKCLPTPKSLDVRDLRHGHRNLS